MTRVSLGVFAFAVVVGLFALAPAAEARWAPSGSYERSCRRIDFDGDLLTATCQRRDGTWRNTWLSNADNCDGDIANDNGQLRCGWSGWRDRDHDRADGPPGSYRHSCQRIRIDGVTLQATCH